MVALVNADCFFDRKEARNWREETHPIKRGWVSSRHKMTPWALQRPTVSVLALSKIIEAIGDAHELTQLAANWDDEGAAPISEETFQRAARFLRSAAMQLAIAGIDLPVPTISPCADGSIDLYWTQGQFRLLMNVQPGNAASDFFGETQDGIQVKGPFIPEHEDVSCFRWLLQQ